MHILLLGGDVLIVGHLSTIETVTRLMSGGRPFGYMKFISFVYEKPFLLIIVLEEPCALNGSWRKVLPPILQIWWQARLLWDMKNMIELLLTCYV